MGLLDGKNLTLTICIIVCLCVIGYHNFGVEAEEEVPETEFARNIGTISILYCYSCGYRKAFEEYATLLNRRYPQFTIHGANYVSAGINMYLSKLIFVVKILLIVLIVSSFNIFGTFGLQTPGWWHHLLNNKLYACMMIFFVGNMLEGQLVASGAFEITLNDVPLWSKLQTGRIPSPQELFQIIDNQFLFTIKNGEMVYVKQ